MQNGGLGPVARKQRLNSLLEYNPEKHQRDCWRHDDAVRRKGVGHRQPRSRQIVCLQQRALRPVQPQVGAGTLNPHFNLGQHRSIRVELLDLCRGQCTIEHRHFIDQTVENPGGRGIRRKQSIRHWCNQLPRFEQANQCPHRSNRMARPPRPDWSRPKAPGRTGTPTPGNR